MPPIWREVPAWAAAAEKVGQDSVTAVAGAIPGSIWELPGAAVYESPQLSLPVNCCRTYALAALKVLCPEQYSGNGGVTTMDSW
jgi:hypothetical protein